MLKISDNQIKIGICIILPNEWHEKILTFGKMTNCPYEFIIEEEIRDKKSKEKYYLCKPDKKENNMDFKIALSEYAVKYLYSQEVPDLNIGLSFKEYLPSEDTTILVTNVRNPNQVVPGVFRIETSLVEIHEKSLICLNFQIKYINGSAFTSVRYYCDGSKKSTWKFLFNEDISYMTDYEKMFRDTLIHKSYIMKSCKRLADYMENNGAVEHAKMLMERAKIHDDSKISCEDELNALSRIINDKSTLVDSSKQLSPIKQDAIKLHWEHNTHHPEHFKTPMDMSKLDIMEMCCDWHARSTQYNTDFLKFVEERQKDRFHFPDWMFAEIWHYCKVLANEI